MARATDMFWRGGDRGAARKMETRAKSENEILVMSGNDKLALPIERHLNVTGFKTVRPRSQKDALDYVASKRPLAVVCDMGTHKQEGEQMLARLHDTPDLQSVPFIFLCNGAKHESNMATANEGHVASVRKPVDPEVLTGRLRTLLKAADVTAGSRAAPNAASNDAPVPKAPGPRVAPPSRAPAIKAGPALPARGRRSSEIKPPPTQGPVPPAPAAAMPATAAEPPADARPSVPSPASPPSPGDAQALVDRADQARADDLYVRAVEYITRQVGACRSGGAIDITGCAELAREIVADVSANDALIPNAIRWDQAFDHPKQSVNVTVFALKIGQGLEYEEDDLVWLAMGGLLHDIGEARLPVELLYKAGGLNKRELAEMQKHPEYGRDMILALGPAEYGWFAGIVAQTHEREQGQGYPLGLVGDQIHEFAKVIAVADVYEALSHPRTFRKAFVPHDALVKLMEMKDTFFPARIVQTLVNEISMFPVGSYVLLNTGVIGKVVAINRSQPLRPLVQVLYNADGTPMLEPAVIDLNARPLLYVSKPIQDDELPAEPSPL